MDERIHPAVRISILLLGATATALGNYYVMATALGVVAFCYVYFPNSYLTKGVRMLKRMRWFFLSILVIYFWFTPGVPIFGMASSLVPTADGIEHGLHRALTLVLIILMVNLLLQTTSSSRLLVAIYWWIRPLRYVGVNTQRIALRVSLVFDFIQRGHEIIDDAKQKVLEKSSAEKNKSKLLGVAIGTAIHQVETQSHQMQADTVELPEADSPPWVQWVYPIGVIMLVFVLQTQ